MALYSQLSDELEQTNRGVVALYAELDEKSERLRVASESKDRFWANVSHELRTPLNSIIGLTRLLAEPGSEAVLDPEQLYQVQLIRNSGSTLLTLVNDLLDVAKAESGRLRIDPAEVELPALLARLRSLVRPMADTSQVSLIVDSENAPATLLTDELALTGILRNLLSNGHQVHQRRRGPADRATTLGVERARSPSPTPASVSPPSSWSASSRSSTRCRASGAAAPASACPTPGGWRRSSAASSRLTSEPGSGTTAVLRLPHGPAAVGTVLVADDDAGYRQLVRGLLSGIAGRVIEAGNGVAGAGRTVARPGGPGPGRPADAGHGRQRTAGAAARRAAGDHHHRPGRATSRGAPRRCCARMSSPGSGWPSPSAASAGATP